MSVGTGVPSGRIAILKSILYIYMSQVVYQKLETYTVHPIILKKIYDEQIQINSLTFNA